MKKAICLTVVLLIIMFMILSCQKSTDFLGHQSVTEDGVNNLYKKGGKGKPANNDPMIHSFTIAGQTVVLNNDVIAEDFVINIADFSSSGQINIPISFHVTHESDPIQFVNIRLYSDWDNNNLNSWGYETVANINKWDYSQTFTLDEEESNYTWNGSVYPLENDPIDIDENVHYELYDQLLTGQKQPDHYQLGIYVQSLDRSHYTDKRTFIWVDANRGPDPVFHVSNIEFVELIDEGKNKVRPVFTVSVHHDNTTNGVESARVFAQFTGIAESAFPTPHNDEFTASDGIAIIKGPSFSKRAKGDLIMTIKNVRTAVYGGYNPGATGNVSQKTFTFPQ